MSTATARILVGEVAYEPVATDESGDLPDNMGIERGPGRLKGVEEPAPVARVSQHRCAPPIQVPSTPVPPCLEHGYDALPGRSGSARWR